MGRTEKRRRARRPCDDTDDVPDPDPPPTLISHRIRLRPLEPADRDFLAAMLAEPEVARWWGQHQTPAETADKLLEDARDPNLLAFVIEVFRPGPGPRAGAGIGEPIGYIQAYEENEPDYRSAGIDISLATSSHGRGLGAEAIRLLARHLFEVRGHHRLTIDPAADNARAIRAYERVGFRPVGVMRRYERGADGTWHDGLLMDLLPEDLTPEPADRSAVLRDPRRGR